jgi:hypothetical protein
MHFSTWIGEPEDMRTGLVVLDESASWVRRRQLDRLGAVFVVYIRIVV